MKYSLKFRLLHWIMSLGIFLIFFAGLYMVQLDNADPTRGNWFYYHQSVGVVLLLLVGGRLFIKKQQPPLPSELNCLDRCIALWVHGLLYGLMILVPAVGIGMTLAKGYGVPFFFFRFPSLSSRHESAQWFGLAHQWGAYILIGFSVIHVIGILKQWVLYRRNLLKRML